VDLTPHAEEFWEVVSLVNLKNALRADHILKKEQ
jgi:hypothetical protein